MDDRKALRDRMTAQPFAPIDSDDDSRNAHALGYIAFYLGAIEQHLGAIAESLARPRVDQAVLVTALNGVEAALRNAPPKAAPPAAMPVELFQPSAPVKAPRSAAPSYAVPRPAAADRVLRDAGGSTPGR